MSDRYERSIRLFGIEGQKRLEATSVVVVGVGGLGSALAQHLALLGVRKIVLIDSEELDETNRNRFIGAKESDPVPGSRKVNLSARLIKEINANVAVDAIYADLLTVEAFEAVKAADVVLGCFDGDGPRAVLNELCAAYERPYIDLASDVPSAGVYGGRVCCNWDGNGCLSCWGELDREAVRRFLERDRAAEQDRVYGIDRGALGEKGPSVSPINGVIASLAATEFMVGVTGLRVPVRFQNFRGHLGGVTIRNGNPSADCIVCTVVRGQGAAADVERFISCR